MTPAKKLATLILNTPGTPFNVARIHALANLILREHPRSPAAGFKPRLDTKSVRKRAAKAAETRLRQKVLSRPGFSCELGEHDHYVWTVELHHLLSGSSKRHDERPSNVIRACRECHERYHREPKSFVPMIVRWCAKHGYPLPNRKIFRGDVSRMVWLAGRRLASTMRRRAPMRPRPGKPATPPTPGRRRQLPPRWLRTPRNTGGIMTETVQFDVEKVKHETSKAILVELDGDEHWVPKSMIADESEVFSLKNGEGTLIVSRWWAHKNGLVDDE